MMKKNRTRILIAALVVALVAMSCDLPFGLGNILGGNPTPTAESIAAPTKAPTQAPAPTEVPTLEPTAEESGVTSDLSSVVLKESDFTDGFVQLSDEELDSMGMTADSMASSFEGTFADAKPQNFSAFMEAENFELAISMVFYPISKVEQSSFDLELADPESAAENFSSGLGSDSGVLEGSDKFGDSSIGFTFVEDSDESASLRGDMVIVRRGDAVILTMIMYMDGATPAVDVLTITDILDQRLAAAQQ